MLVIGVNANEMGFTPEWASRPIPPELGLGQGFLSRNLTDARRADDAQARVLREGICGGHSSNRLGIGSKAIPYIEDTQESHAVRSICESDVSHANQYDPLTVPGETLTNNSLIRIGRAMQLHTAVCSLHYHVFDDELSHYRGELVDQALHWGAQVRQSQAQANLGNFTDGQMRATSTYQCLLAPMVASAPAARRIRF